MTISTTTSVTEAVYAKIVANQIQDSIKENVILAAACHESNTEGQPSLVGQYLYADGLTTSAPQSQGAATTASEFTLSEATATAAERCVAVEIADLAEDSSAVPLAPSAIREMTLALTDYVEDAIGAILAGFTAASQSVSDTGVAADFDDLLTLKTNLRLNAKGKANRAAFYLYDNTVLQLQKLALNGTNGLMPALSRENLVAIMGDTVNSSVLGAQAGSFCGIPVFQTSHVPAINAQDVDSAGALICTGEGGAILLNWKWRVKIEIAKTTVNGKFGKFMLAGVAMGVAEARDTLGATLITKRAA
jgi:HK97 family phage major capsid protein